MDYCQKLSELFKILLDKDSNLDQKITAKSKILEICKHIPDVPQNILSIMIKGYSDDIDTYLNSPTYSKNSMEQLRTSLKLKFGCPYVKTIER